MVTANLNYDLLPPLLSALAAKSPLVGIPMPGDTPLILNRAKLQAALRGVEPMYVTVEGAGESRYLSVQGIASNRVRTKMCMLAIPRRAIRRGTSRVSDWGTFRDSAKAFWTFCDTKPTQPKARGSAKLAALDRKIAKLKAQKQGMMRSLRWAKPTVYGEDVRRAILAWYLGKQERRDPKFRNPLTRINEGHRLGWWAKHLLAPCGEPPTPAQRYAFLRNEEYLVLREEIRGLETIKAELAAQ
jgi:hypothetical protein